MPGLTVALAYTGAACVVWLVVMLVLEGWTPVFFVQGQGGTPLRDFVLGSATVMFVFTTAILWRRNRRPFSAFVRWYGLALLLVATGLFGIMIESVHGGVLSWTGRAAQYLGGAYMLIAAFASVRESHAWRISLEAALREERDFSAAVLDTAGVVVVLDAQGRITRFNRACERLTGYPAAEVLGRVFWEFLIPPEGMAPVMEAWKAIDPIRVPTRHENHWLTCAGTRRLIDWSNTVLPGETGEVQHIIAIGIDITERKRAEEELKRHRQHLEEMVDQRTAELRRVVEELQRTTQILRDLAALARPGIRQGLPVPPGVRKRVHPARARQVGGGGPGQDRRRVPRRPAPRRSRDGPRPHRAGDTPPAGRRRANPSA